MSRIEKEIKILDVDVKKTYEKLKTIGADFINVKKQELYTYDLPTIYNRYLEIIELLKINNQIINNNSLIKLEILLDEFVDLLNDKKLNKIYEEMDIIDFSSLFKLDNNALLKKLIESKLFNKEIKNKLINPNKWIRLRKSNDEIELTVKHIYEKNKSSIQKVIENEIIVSDFEETNKLLNSIGIVRRNYQEKIRHSFKYKSASIEIDEWPLIKPYIEIECNDDIILGEIIELLGYTFEDVVSINTAQLYSKIGLNIKDIIDLKF